ncbi:MAG: alpha-1,4-glucan--maltose-1-phosphate maltosyltransferase [Gemmatimonadota bacterium]|nr:alpha-1,4-glucan--maltose-1-phosphate maltosyltransferase [Gemmatimonadota bacterium]
MSEVPQREGRRRVVIERVTPEIDCGRFAAKGVAGDDLVVEADAFSDGHDAISVVLLWRSEDEEAWSETPMEPLGNDRWRARFPLAGLGRHIYTVEAWVDRFETWRQDLAKRLAADQDLSVPLEVGAGLLEEAAARAERAGADDDAEELEAWAGRLRVEAAAGVETADHPALDPALASLARRYPDREHATRYPRELAVFADRPIARFGAWYEFFPRSTGPGEDHGTFRTAMEFLPYVAEMGFDVVYLPPIHPIGETNRKGPNNAVHAGPDDPGSPWAIGSAEGGHTAIHPELGTLEDFHAFREEAESLGLEVALDVAFQCSPDHPWVEEHPEWFRHRPDGSIQYAENPPKKYEDIYPLDFESEAWPELWEALKGVFEHWIGEGVRIFRVDNPHTKPFAFWEWAIGELREAHPGVVFLSEAFTRPKVMYRLAKLGFSQSYTYFAWRNQRWELESYLTEVTTPPVSHFFRPALWPNTPDILTEYLQTGGRPAFVARLVLAATAGASYGIYGPAFELLEATPREPGSEEYLDSEKYQIRDWNLSDGESLRPVVERVNRIRRENPALHRDDTLRFHPVDDEALVAYSKKDPDGANAVLTVVNLDPHHTRAGWVDLRLDALGLDTGESYQVHDLLGGSRHLWRGARNYVELNPNVMPAHVFRISRKTRTERDFEYFL